MIKQILEMIIEQFDKKEVENEYTTQKKLELLDELEELEIELAGAKAEAERWADPEEFNHYRNVKVRKLERLVEVKKEKIEKIMLL